MFKAFLLIGFVLPYISWAVPFAGAAPAGPLAQVIEGAKKEGAVALKLAGGPTQKSTYRLEKEIKEKYGVDLKVRFTSSSNMPNDVAEAIMEQKAGAIPSYDLLSLSSHVATANQAGVLEKVDWKPLISEGTNPNVIHDNPLMYGGIVFFTAHLGLVYNPEKVKAEEIPKTVGELANPRWKGKAGITNLINSWLRSSFVLGKENVLSTLRAVLKNGAIQGTYVDLWNRYLIGEVWSCTVNSGFIIDAREKGLPAAWQSLDFADVREYSLALRKGARNPNAAKLVSIYLASPEGARFMFEEGRAGNLYYSGNFEHDIRVQDQKQGIREVFGDRNTEILKFYDSKEATQWQKEIMLVLQTGGTR
jgi:ABC-type Fe3+ transport system substrate-binding protein